MTKDDFENWLISMDDYLDEFLELESSLSGSLDFSPSSLSIVELRLLERFSSIEEILKDENNKYLNACSVYVGETYRKNVGGKWKIELDDVKDVYYHGCR